MNHTKIQHESPEDQCDCEATSSIPFLDTMCTIKEGRTDIGLYKKDTDKNQYLLPSSCYPASTIKSIPYSPSLRIYKESQSNTKKGPRQRK